MRMDKIRLDDSYIKKIKEWFDKNKINYYTHRIDDFELCITNPNSRRKVSGIPKSVVLFLIVAIYCLWLWEKIFSGKSYTDVDVVLILLSILSIIAVTTILDEILKGIYKRIYREKSIYVQIKEKTETYNSDIVEVRK